MHNPFHHTKTLTYYKDQNIVENFNLEYTGNGYYHEIVEVMACLREGKTESEKMPLSFSLQLINLLDKVREKIGLSYE